MNRQRLIKLREQLQNLPGGFDYGTFGRREEEILNDVDFIKITQNHPCGTSACVAAWCVILNLPEKILSRDECMFDADDISKHYLGLTNDERDFLFFPGSSFPDNDFLSDFPDKKTCTREYSLQDALDRIDHLLNRPSVNQSESN